MRLVFRPKPSAWVLLFIPAGPIIGVGIWAIGEGDWIEGSAAALFGIFIIMYNASLSITIDENIIQMRRYGFEVWRMPRKGSVMSVGKGGDFGILPSFILKNNHSEQSEYILKSWFSNASMKEMRDLLDSVPES